jgi:anti-anti-sigma factor
MDTPVTASPRRPENNAVLHVSGEVDLLTAPILRDRIHQAISGGRHNLLVDLSAVTFMDCAGMGPLLEARTELGTRLRLRGLPDSLVRILRVCDLRATFTVLDDTDTATESLAALAAGGEPRDRRTVRALDLQEAVASAPVIEEAKGLLMGTLGCDADDAWQLLLGVCRKHRVRVGDLAAVLVGDAAGTFDGIADPPLMDALRAVLPPAREARARAQ